MASMGEPASLLVGTEVSAKYKGAFCEATVKEVQKTVKCKVTLKETQAQFVVPDSAIKGEVKNGARVEVKDPDSSLYREATINKVSDASQYTVVFDDGDVTRLRRSQLVLKGEKHFNETATLDQLPLTHPEHFGTPVVSLKKEQRRVKASPGGKSIDYMDSSDEDRTPSPQRFQRRTAAAASERRFVGLIPPISAAQAARASHPAIFNVGRVISVEGTGKVKWFPALVVRTPSSAQAMHEVVSAKSFRDNKILSVAMRHAVTFQRDKVSKQDDKSMKMAFERAILYLDSGDLPPNWSKEQLLMGSDDSESDQSGDEEGVTRTEFFANFDKWWKDFQHPPYIYKRSVNIGGKKLRFSRFYRAVNLLGGAAEVTTTGMWKEIGVTVGHPPGTAHYGQIKPIYKKYLQAFEEWHRTVGQFAEEGRSTRGMKGRSGLSVRKPCTPSAVVTSSKGSPGKGKPKVDDGKVQGNTRSGTDRRGRTQTDPGCGPSGGGAEEGRITGARLRGQDVATAAQPARKRTRMGSVEGPRVSELPARYRHGADIGLKSRADSPRSVSSVDKSSQRGARASRAAVTKEEKGAVGRKRVKEEESPTTAGSMRSRSSVRGADESPKVKTEPLDSSIAEDDEQSLASSSGGQNGSVSTTSISAVAYTREVDFPPGTRLQVAYGGKSTKKVYEAKVQEVDEETETGELVYLVHYAGWNVRHDEWIHSERIVNSLGKVEKKKVDLPRTYVATGGSPIIGAAKRKLPLGRSPLVRSADPKSPCSGASSSCSETKPAVAVCPTVSAVLTASASRPTRSNSIEVNLSGGLPVRKRERHRTISGHDPEKLDPASEEEDEVREALVKKFKKEPESSPSAATSKQQSTAGKLPSSETSLTTAAVKAAQAVCTSPPTAVSLSQSEVSSSTMSLKSSATGKPKESASLLACDSSTGSLKLKDSQFYGKSLPCEPASLTSRVRNSPSPRPKDTHGKDGVRETAKRRQASPVSAGKARGKDVGASPAKEAGVEKDGSAPTAGVKGKGSAVETRERSRLSTPDRLSKSASGKVASSPRAKVALDECESPAAPASRAGRPPLKRKSGPVAKDKSAASTLKEKSQSKERISSIAAVDKPTKASKAASAQCTVNSKAPTAKKAEPAAPPRGRPPPTKEKPSTEQPEVDVKTVSRAGSKQRGATDKSSSSANLEQSKDEEGVVSTELSSLSKLDAVVKESAETSALASTLSAAVAAALSEVSKEEEEPRVPSGVTHPPASKTEPKPSDWSNSSPESPQRPISQEPSTVASSCSSPVSGSSKEEIAAPVVPTGSPHVRPSDPDMETGIPASRGDSGEDAISADPTADEPKKKEEPISKGPKKNSKKAKKKTATSKVVSGEGCCSPAVASPAVGTFDSRPVKRTSSDMGYKPVKRPRYNFNIKADVEKLKDEDSQIEYLEERVALIRKLYAEKKLEMANLEKRRKRQKRKERDQGSQPTENN